MVSPVSPLKLELELELAAVLELELEPPFGWRLRRPPNCVQLVALHAPS